MPRRQISLHSSFDCHTRLHVRRCRVVGMLKFDKEKERFLSRTCEQHSNNRITTVHTVHYTAHQYHIPLCLKIMPTRVRSTVQL